MLPNRVLMTLVQFTGLLLLLANAALLLYCFITDAKIING